MKKVQIVGYINTNKDYLHCQIWNPLNLCSNLVFFCNWICSDMNEERFKMYRNVLIHFTTRRNNLKTFGYLSVCILLYRLWTLYQENVEVELDDDWMGGEGRLGTVGSPLLVPVAPSPCDCQLRNNNLIVIWTAVSQPDSLWQFLSLSLILK